MAVPDIPEAKLLDIIRFGARPPELRVECCDSMDLQVNQDADDRLEWEVECISCGSTVCFIGDRHPDHI